MGKVQRLAYFLSDLSPVSYYYFILLVLYLLGPCPLGLISDIGASCPVFFFQIQIFFQISVFFQVHSDSDSERGFCCSGKSIAPNAECCCCHYATAEV